MLLRRIELCDFRCYGRLQVTVDPGLTLLLGSNAQGKTAFLEALYVLSAARSFRARSDLELLRWGTQAACVSAELARDSGRPRRLEMRWHNQGGKVHKQAFLQGRPIARLADFLRELPVALFRPDDLALVQGGPAGRRRYMDLQLCKLYPGYLSALNGYLKALKQRNQLLRRRPPPGELELAPWDQLLATLGTAVSSRRAWLLDQVNANLKVLYPTLSGEDCRLGLGYQPAAPGEVDGFLARLAAQREVDIRRGSTFTGPHRDDFDLDLGGRDLRRFGSQGQQRTAALGLRLAEARVLSEEGAEKAIVLLDDCFSELDEGRQERLLDLLDDCPQVLVTSASPLKLPRSGSTMRVQGATVVVEKRRSCSSL